MIVIKFYMRVSQSNKNGCIRNVEQIKHLK